MPLLSPALSRRTIMRIGGLGAASVALGGPVRAMDYPAPKPADIGGVVDGKVQFPAWQADTEKPDGPPPAPMAPGQRVGFAIVGLGKLALGQILPAFGASKMARPVALVSGHPDKAKAVAGQYGIPDTSIYGYDSFDAIANNPAVDVVYIVLPNGMHREFVERAAKAGKHVMCEKPFATSVADARAMVTACRDAKVKLMVAYRCQYEPYNREARRRARSGQYGPIRFIEATNFQTMGTGDQWRFSKALAGGGALPDIGLYCLNAARFITGEEPVEISANLYSPPGDKRYAEVEETIRFWLRFPSGALAACQASYGMHNTKSMRITTPAAIIDMPVAFAYEGQRLSIAHRDGEAESEDGLHLTAKNQFALEMDHMAQCVRQNREPHTPGEEGLQDQILMQAIYEAAASGTPTRLDPVNGRDTTRGPEPLNL